MTDQSDSISPIQANSVKAAEYGYNVYTATIPQAATVESILDPKFWTNIASSTHFRLNPTDEIRCVWEDFSRYARILVVRPSKVDVIVSLIENVDLRAVAGDIDLGSELSNYLIRFAGAGIGFRIIRKADGSVVKDNDLPTEDAARQWLVAHVSDGALASVRTAPKAAKEKQKAAA